MCEQKPLTVLEILDGPIAFHRCFVTITVSKDKFSKGKLGVAAALMLSQALYWSNRTTAAEGWFYKSIKEWEEETGLTRFEQEEARRRLRDTGFWIEKLTGRSPATVHFRIDAEKLAAALGISQEKPLAQFAENQQTGLRKTSKLVRGKLANKLAGKQQTIKEQRLHRDYTEITTESSARKTAPPPKRSTPRNSSSAKAESIPPAIEFIKQLTNLYPAKELWPGIVEFLGADFDRERLSNCYLEWRGRGFKPTNYRGWLFDWYIKGIPEHGGINNGKSTTRKSEGQKLAEIRDYFRDCPAISQ